MCESRKHSLSAAHCLSYCKRVQTFIKPNAQAPCTNPNGSNPHTQSEQNGRYMSVSLLYIYYIYILNYILYILFDIVSTCFYSICFCYSIYIYCFVFWCLSQPNVGAIWDLHTHMEPHVELAIFVCQLPMLCMPMWAVASKQLWVDWMMAEIVVMATLQAEQSN